MNYSSEEQQRYAALCEDTAKQLDAAQELLRSCSTEIAECDPQQLNGLADKLRNDRFNLVLTGGFQTGKSTMFCYLCGGRELSPVGAGGGGIRTSGARVAAIPVQEGEKEFAVIKWRTPDELLASLGSWLVPYYVEARKKQGVQDIYRDYVTSQDINLDDAAARNRLAALSLEKLNDIASSLGGEVIELVRMALLIAWFYPYYRELIHRPDRQTRYDSLEHVVRMASYPKGWEQRWKRMRENGWKEGFTHEDVPFVFIHSIEYHIDSFYLRQLGCCLVDSPGLSASKWDSDIAAQCMNESDAVLYIFKGDKAISMDDCANVNICAESGADGKLLFGANLRMPRFRWTDCRDVSILLLERDNYKVSSFYDFHAGIALRAAELCALADGKLHSSAQEALDRELAAAGMCANDENRRTLLTQLLDDYLNEFTKPNQIMKGKCLSDYTEKAFGEEYINYQELEELSGIPAFIRAARREVLARKKESLLRRNGSRRIIDALSAAQTAMKEELGVLSNRLAGQDIDIESKQKENKRYAMQCQTILQKLDTQFRNSDNYLTDLYADRLNKALLTKKAEIIELTANSFVGPWNQIAQGRNPAAPVAAQILMNYNARLEVILKNVLCDLCRFIAVDIVQRPAYQLALSEYNNICGLYNLDPKATLIPHQAHDNFVTTAHIPGWGGNIMDHIRQGNWLALFMKPIPGVMTERDRATAAVNACWNDIGNGMQEVLRENILYRRWEQSQNRRGPLQQMWDVRDAFKAHLDMMLQNKKEALERARVAASECKQQMETKCMRLKELSKQAETMLSAARKLDELIQNELEN
ncbi:MAG: hypothetical protein II295_07815 [Akkermansia sp.]|nr:hypothetical protein [Akkermansia sp.]